jgi:hypothetical protein
MERQVTSQFQMGLTPMVILEQTFLQIQILAAKRFDVNGQSVGDT